MWTLYKNYDPKLDQQPGWADYYQLRLIPHPNNRLEYKVEEYHGWFNDEIKKNQHHIRILASDDGFQTWDQAMALVRQQLLYLAETGYVHQLTFDPYSAQGFAYVVLDPAKLREAI